MSAGSEKLSLPSSSVTGCPVALLSADAPGVFAVAVVAGCQTHYQQANTDIFNQIAH
jgi:hypothetical protein